MHPLRVVIIVLSGFMPGMALADDDGKITLSDCPAAVRKTFQAEVKAAKIESVNKEKDDDGETIYRTGVVVGGKAYTVGVLEDGTLAEMALAVDEESLPFDRCPAAVQATFRSEAMGENVDAVGRDVKYGVVIYQTVVNHKGKAYEIVVAEDGTLVEKVLIIEDEAVKLSDCPAAVRAALHDHAMGGEISEITRSTGIGHHTYEAAVRMKAKVYSIEVAKSGQLISKSLEAVKDQ